VCAAISSRLAFRRWAAEQLRAAYWRSPPRCAAPHFWSAGWRPPVAPAPPRNRNSLCVVASRTMKLSRSLSPALQAARELADPDGSNPETAASSTASIASAAADCAAAAAAASSAHCAPAAASCTASAPSGGKLYAGTMCCSVFLVEDIESRQADVRDFLLSEEYRCGVLRRYIAS
jgi:hypothetical protein